MKIKELPEATPLNSEELKALIPNITTQGELNEFEAKNIADAVLWTAISTKLKKDLLSASGLYELHKKMFDQTWEWAGKTRLRQTNIGIPVENIQNELGAIIGDVTYWLENNTYSIEEIAIHFHHKLVFIHPFSNGNGRWARLAADLLLKYNNHEGFSWGQDDLTKDGPNRKKYLKALRCADKSYDYEPLLEFAKS